MGTGKVQTDKIPEIIKEFDTFEKRIWPIMGGDDTLFDHFIRARDRMEELAAPSDTGWGPDGRSPVGGLTPPPKDCSVCEQNNAALAEALAAGYGIDDSAEIADAVGGAVKDPMEQRKDELKDDPLLKKDYSGPRIFVSFATMGHYLPEFYNAILNTGMPKTNDDLMKVKMGLANYALGWKRFYYERESDHDHMLNIFIINIQEIA
jgi:hypothetical protein